MNRTQDILSEVRLITGCTLPLYRNVYLFLLLYIILFFLSTRCFVSFYIRFEHRQSRTINMVIVALCQWKIETKREIDLYIYKVYIIFNIISVQCCT